MLSFQASDSKNNQPFTASGRLSRSSLVNLAPSSTSAPSLAILLAITGALPPKMDLWSDMANAVSVSSLNSVLLLTNLLKTQQSHILLYYFNVNGALLNMLLNNYKLSGSCHEKVQVKCITWIKLQVCTSFGLNNFRSPQIPWK